MLNLKQCEFKENVCSTKIKRYTCIFRLEYAGFEKHWLSLRGKQMAN